MTLEIHAPQADTLAEALAKATGEDLDNAVVRAIEERLACVPRRRSADRDTDIDALFDQPTEMPVLDSRSPDEIIGYSANGLPSLRSSTRPLFSPL